jgi:putative Mg2+ transporter-C (MgtC) family protein
MNPLMQEFASELSNMDQLIRVIVRLAAAALIGAVVGIQRELAHKSAGLRTHMLVSVGACFFVVGCLRAGMSIGDLSRVIQGLATGIGFIGGGVILKISERNEVRGLTTAASLWMTAAVGVAAGLGCLVTAIVGGAVTWFILAIVGGVERRFEMRKEPGQGS